MSEEKERRPLLKIRIGKTLEEKAKDQEQKLIEFRKRKKLLDQIKSAKTEMRKDSVLYKSAKVVGSGVKSFVVQVGKNQVKPATVIKKGKKKGKKKGRRFKTSNSQSNKPSKGINNGFGSNPFIR